MHMDDGNMLKSFQQIAVQNFREINLYQLQSFFNFLDIHASI